MGACAGATEGDECSRGRVSQQNDSHGVGDIAQWHRVSDADGGLSKSGTKPESRLTPEIVRSLSTELRRVNDEMAIKQTARCG